MLDLDGRVVDVEFTLDQLGQLEAGSVTVGILADGDVGGKGGEFGGDLPDVQVVDLDDARLFGHHAADPVGVELLGRGLEEDPPRVTQQPDRRAQHQAGNQQRGDRVGAVEAGQQDHRRGDRGADEGVEVGQQVLEAALDVEALAVGSGEGRGGGEGDDDSSEGDYQDQRAVHRGGRDESPHRLDRDDR